MKPFFGKLTARELALKTWQHVNDHEIVTRANSIAFCAMMAAVPFLALVITIGVYLLPDLSGSGALGIGALTPDQLHNALRGMLPEEIYQIVADQIARMQAQPPVGIISISIAITLWSSSSLYMAIIGSLNLIYGVEETRPYWRLRLQAMLITVVQSAILLAGVVIMLTWPRVVTGLGLTQGHDFMLGSLQHLAVFVLLLISFAITFAMGSGRAKQGQKWVTPGSVFGALVFMLASWCFRLYVANFGHYDKVYGSLGGVMMALFWLYISSMVLLVAAEMNRIVDYATIRYDQNQRRDQSRSRRRNCQDEGGHDEPTSGIVPPHLGKRPPHDHARVPSDDGLLPPNKGKRPDPDAAKTPDETSLPPQDAAQVPPNDPSQKSG